MSEVRRGFVVTLADPAEAAQAAADRFVHLARSACDAMGVFRVALSGGSTPRAMLALLAEEPNRSAIDWGRVQVFWADERAVRPSDPESNYRLAYGTLLSKVSIPESHVFRMPADQADLDEAARQYEETLREETGAAGGDPPVLDLVLLGLGEDGHTASLFPGSAAIAEAHRAVLAVDGPSAGTAGASPPVRRMTLTPLVLNAARERVFLVTGTAKAAMIHNVLEGPYQPDVWPAQIVEAHRSLPLWILDEDAARELDDGKR